LKKLTTSTLTTGLILTILLTIGDVAALSPERTPVIIRFRDKTNASLIQTYGGDIKYIYDIIPAVACSLSPTLISILRKDPTVAYVQQDSITRISQEQLPWGVNRIDAEVVHHYNKGTGIKIAVIDTGIDYDHPDLDANIAGGKSFVRYTNDYMDDNGHGTHVAGIIAAEDNEAGVIGVAPEAELYALKALDSEGDGYVSDIVAAIDWSVANDVQIISMSIGSNRNDVSLHEACDNAYNAGVLLVGAAGNDGNMWGSGDNVDYPARYDSVIAVVATEKNDNRAVWGWFRASSTGPAVELAAPGDDIYSTYLGNTYATFSGTSMACPHVSGTAALVFNSPMDPAYDLDGDSVWDASEVREKLKDTADDLGSVGQYNQFGWGLVDADEAARQPVMHIKSIHMSKATGWLSFKIAAAIVTILDTDGNLVEEATIYGTWSGLTKELEIGITGSNGEAIFYTWIWGVSGTCTFTVNNVAKSGWIYDPLANRETSDGITL
jgi:subtilisin family serine protease